MMPMNPKRPSPGGNKVTHSKPTTFGSGSSTARMPAQQPPARFNMKNDHTCKVCPGAKRMK